MWATGWWRGRSEGFTLLELMIVAVILGLFWASAGIRLDGAVSGGDLGLAARRLSGEIRELRGRAAHGHKEQVLVVHLTRNRYWPSESREDAEESAFEWLNHADDSIPENAAALPRGVFFDRAAVLGEETRREGLAEIRFFANGCVERSLLTIRNEKGRSLTLEIHPLTGRVELHEGTVEQRAA